MRGAGVGGWIGLDTFHYGDSGEQKAVCRLSMLRFAVFSPAAILKLRVFMGQKCRERGPVLTAQERLVRPGGKAAARHFYQLTGDLEEIAVFGKRRRHLRSVGTGRLHGIRRENVRSTSMVGCNSFCYQRGIDIRMRIS